MMGGQATTILPIMWVLVGIVFVFMGLRMYTRTHVLDQLGMDDHVFNLSGIFLFLYTVFVQVAAEYGFGQDIAVLTADDAAKAIKWEMVGQTFAVLGMAIAKWSMGLFLLRIVMQRWHRVAIWATMVSLLLVSLLTAVIFWIQCLPPAAIYDKRVEGKCIIRITPISILLGAWCIFADFFFATLPWVFIWSLNMSKREKVTIAGSMSFGLFAGACGIVRTVALEGFDSSNYTEATVGLIVWSAAELAITMVCTGIPVLRPLFSRWFPLLGGSSRDKYGRQNSEAADGPVYTMHTIGGKIMKGRRGGRAAAGAGGGGGRGGGGGGGDGGFQDDTVVSGLRSPTTKTRITAQGTNGSEEEILGSVHRRVGGGEVAADKGDGIFVREDITVDYDSDRAPQHP